MPILLLREPRREISKMIDIHVSSKQPHLTKNRISLIFSARNAMLLPEWIYLALSNLRNRSKGQDHEQQKMTRSDELGGHYFINIIGRILPCRAFPSTRVSPTVTYIYKQLYQFYKISSGKTTTQFLSAVTARPFAA